jgi:arginase
VGIQPAINRLTLISVPFDHGVRGVGMGRGPLELVNERAVADRLRDGLNDLDVDVVEIREPPDGPEVGRIFAINRDVSACVRRARGENCLPVVVAGNCNVCLGALGGVGSARCGIVWLDAHGDFHTPDTTESGFFDGMGLAIATGACWRGLAASIPGFHPVAESHTILVGVRDTEPREQDRLDQSAVTVIAGGSGRGRLATENVAVAVRRLAEQVDGIYLHVDLDVLDPSLGRANQFATPGGLDLADLGAIAEIVAAAAPVATVAFASYNPAADPAGAFGDVAVQAVVSVINAITS